MGKLAVEQLNGFGRRSSLIEVDRAAHCRYPCFELEFLAAGRRNLLQKLQCFLAFAVLRQRETLLRSRCGIGA